MMLKSLKSFYYEQQFFPSLAGVFVNPFYFARSGLCSAITEFAPTLKGKILDVGCGSKPYIKLFTYEEYIGLDIDSPSSRATGKADHFYDGNAFPFNANEFDSLICQVLEHVFNPNAFISEINKVLKARGKLLLTVPFVWDEHEQPYDYARYSTFGLFSLLENNGFKVLKHKKLGADISVVFQMLNAYLFKTIQNWPIYIRLAFTILVIGPITLAGLIARKVLPANPDLFLDHAILAEKQ